MLVLVLASSGPAAATGVPQPSPRRVPEVPPDPAWRPPPRPVIRRNALAFPGSLLFLDPDPYVSTKEFTLFHNLVPAPGLGPGAGRELFHLVYQRSGGPQASERTFGHAWSSDLLRWSVDTLAFTTDTTAWNAAHVWSPSLVHHEGRDYLFYTGVDEHEDQSIGFAVTELLDTTNTVWELERVQVLSARDAPWAAVDPWTYSGQTQFRDPFVMPDPDDPARLLMVYAAHDTVDLAAGTGGLVVGLARSEPGQPDVWRDAGYYRSTLPRTTRINQMEGPHLFRSPGTDGAWWLMFSSGGSPPGEAGQGTIRFQRLAPGYDVTDTSFSAWTPGPPLMSYLEDDFTVFGWSGSEQARWGTFDLLAGFTAWGPQFQGIALGRMRWSGDDFVLERPSVTAVDEWRSPSRDVRLEIVGGGPAASWVEFRIESPAAFEARLEVFDVSGRRVATPLEGSLAPGSSRVRWRLGGSGGVPLASGVYLARLTLPGGVRVARLVVTR